MTTNTPLASVPTSIADSPRYLAPSWIVRRVLNGVIQTFARLGLDVNGTRQLAVRGRTSGEWRTVPVNPLTIDGARYLVAPRGTTEWVRNVRAAGTGEIRLGRTVEVFEATEVADDVKPAILREYLRRWHGSVAEFFDGVEPDSSDDQFVRLASGIPVFAITTAA